MYIIAAERETGLAKFCGVVAWVETWVQGLRFARILFMLVIKVKKINNVSLQYCNVSSRLINTSERLTKTEKCPSIEEVLMKKCHNIVFGEKM